jgi:hypothetical protein
MISRNQETSRKIDEHFAQNEANKKQIKQLEDRQGIILSQMKRLHELFEKHQAERYL